MRKNYQIFTEIISIKKNWPSQNIDFLNFKKVSLGQSLANLNSRRIYWILKLLLVILKSEVWKKKVFSFFIILILEVILKFWSRWVHAFIWTKEETLIKNKTESKKGKSYTPVWRNELFASSYARFKNY